MRRLVAAVIVALAFAPALAKLEVKFDDRVDFKSFRTFAFAKGTPAAYPQVQQAIEASVAGALESKGLRRVDPGEADLHVKTYAFGQTEVAAGLRWDWIPGWNFGYLAFDVNDINSGTLIVDLHDTERDEPVWRAIATRDFKRELAKVQAKIDGMVKKMFRDYPPR
jgi:hypothetical protein